MNSFFLWGALIEKSYAEKENAILRENIEIFVDEFAARAFVEKYVIDPMIHHPSDYEVPLTPKGRMLIDGTLPKEPDIQIPEIEK